MVDKPDKDKLYQQALDEYKAHTGRDMEPADAAAFKKGLEDALKTPTTLDKDISLKNDAKLIADSVTKGGISFGSAILGIPGDITHWARGKMGYEVAENPFLSSTYIGNTLKSGYEGTLRLTGNELPAAETEREKALTEAFEKGTEYSLSAYTLRGAGTALYGFGRSMLGKAFGTAARTTASGGEATATATKIDNAVKAATSKAAPVGAAKIENVAKMGDEAKASGTTMGESAGTSTKAASSVRDTREMGDAWIYLSREKKLGLAQKLEAFTERGSDKYLKLLTDRMRFEKISDDQIAAIRTSFAQSKITEQTMQTFEEIYNINKLSLPFRFAERMKGRLNFVTEHQGFGSLYAGKTVGATIAAPTIFAVQHPLLATSIVAGDYYATNNLVTGAILRSQIAMPQSAWLLAKMSPVGGGDGSSLIPSKEGVVDAANLTVDATETFSTGVGEGMLNMTESAFKQVGLQFDKEKARGHVTGLAKLFMPFGITATQTGAGAYADTNKPGGNGTIEENLAHRVVDGIKEDASTVVSIATDSTKTRAGQEINQKAGNLIAKADGTLQQVLTPPASGAPASENNPDMIQAAKAGVMQAMNTTGQAIKEHAPGVATAGGAVVAAVSPVVKDGMGKASDAAADTLHQLEEKIRQEKEDLEAKRVQLAQQMKEQKDQMLAQLHEKEEDLEKKFAERKAELEKTGKQIIDTSKGVVQAGMFGGLTAAFSHAGDWIKDMIKPLTDMAGVDADGVLKVGLFALAGATLGSFFDNKSAGLMLGLIVGIGMAAYAASEGAAGTERTASLKQDERRRDMAPVPS